MKKLVSTLLALLMACAALPVLADADTTDRAEILREGVFDVFNPRADAVAKRHLQRRLRHAAQAQRPRG